MFFDIETEAAAQEESRQKLDRERLQRSARLLAANFKKAVERAVPEDANGPILERVNWDLVDALIKGLDAAARGDVLLGARIQDTRGNRSGNAAPAPAPASDDTKVDRRRVDVTKGSRPDATDTRPQRRPGRDSSDDNPSAKPQARSSRPWSRGTGKHV